MGKGLLTTRGKIITATIIVGTLLCGDRLFNERPSQTVNDLNQQESRQLSEESSLESRTDAAIGDALETKRKYETGLVGLNDYVQKWKMAAEAAKGENNYDYLIRSNYNICDLLLDKGKDYSAVIAKAKEGIDIIKDETKPVSQEWANYRDDLHLKAARAYARTDSSTQRGVEMFDHYFQVIWLNKNNEDPGQVAGALKDLMDIPSTHKSARKKYETAMKSYTEEARQLIQKQIKEYLQAQLNNASLGDIAKKALDTYRL